MIFSTFAVLTWFAVTSGAFAAPSSFTVSLKKAENSNTLSPLSVVDRDRARARYLLSGATHEHDVPATDQVTFYTLSVGIGRPQTYYDLIIDTGSSNTLCGIKQPYVRTSTSIPTGQTLNLAYGNGSTYVRGNEYLDQVALGNGFTITNQSIGGVTHSSSSGFNYTNLDGILGVGPTVLTLQTLSPANSDPIPTVMDNLFSQGLIEHKILGVYFTPLPKNTSDTTGALTFGGVDPTLFKGEVTYAPVTETQPSSFFFGINITLTYGNTAIIPKSSAGIVDTGTAMILLADEFFNAYMRAIPGASLNSSAGLIDIPLSSIPQMQPLYFMIGNKSLTLDVDAQLAPRSQNALRGLDPNKQYGTIASLGNLTWFDFIMGVFFMERYYAVFDSDNHRVGFAETNHTFSQSY